MHGQFLEFVCGNEVSAFYIGLFSATSGLPMVPVVRDYLGVTLLLPFLAWCIYLGSLGEQQLALRTVPEPAISPRGTLVFRREPAFSRLRLPRPRARLTIGRMMIAVAVIALMIWADVNRFRWRQQMGFGWRIESEAREESFWRRLERAHRQQAVELEKRGDNASSLRAQAAQERAKADYHAKRKREHEEASRGFALPAGP